MQNRRRRKIGYTILSNFHLAGMESRFLIGYTNCTVWVWNIDVKYVRTLFIWAGVFCILRVMHLLNDIMKRKNFERHFQVRHFLHFWLVPFDNSSLNRSRGTHLGCGLLDYPIQNTSTRSRESMMPWLVRALASKIDDSDLYGSQWQRN